MATLFKTVHIVPICSKYHIYIASDGVMCIHNKAPIFIDDEIHIGSTFKATVTEIIEKRKKSITYPKHEFYILRFTKNENILLPIHR